jgi:hypothetical protein
MEEVTSLSRRLQGASTSRPDRVGQTTSNGRELPLRLNVYGNDFMIKDGRHCNREHGAGKLEGDVPVSDKQAYMACTNAAGQTKLDGLLPNRKEVSIRALHYHRIGEVDEMDRDGASVSWSFSGSPQQSLGKSIREIPRGYFRRMRASTQRNYCTPTTTRTLPLPPPKTARHRIKNGWREISIRKYGRAIADQCVEFSVQGYNTV